MEGQQAILKTLVSKKTLQQELATFANKTEVNANVDNIINVKLSPVHQKMDLYEKAIISQQLMETRTKAKQLLDFPIHQQH